MHRIMITGATGLLGRAMYKEFIMENCVVRGFGYSRARGDILPLDLHNADAVREFVQDFQPDAIIHCAAQRSLDRVEKEYEESRKLNVDCSEILARIASEVRAVFVYISTDYVFDGTCPPYKEDDLPTPLNGYGASKYEGEQAVMRVCKDSIILRIPVLYGDEEFRGESAVSSLIDKLLIGEPVAVSNYEVRFPSHAEDITKICFQLVDKRLKFLMPRNQQIYHWCGSEALTKYDMIKIIGEEFNLPTDHVSPDDKPSHGVPRPKNTKLSCEKLNHLKIGKHTKFSEGVAKCFKKFI